MSHKDWVAVGDLPGTRIKWRYEMKGRRYDFFDETGTYLGSENNDNFLPASETVSETYFSKAGLRPMGLGPVIIPWPTWRRGYKWGTKANIEMPDGRRLRVWFKGYSRQRSAVLKVLDESGEPLVAVRWTGKDSFFSAPGYKRHGEAVIAPGKVLPTEPVLFAAYAVHLLIQATDVVPVATG